jgi:hypothetical protein
MASASHSPPIVPYGADQTIYVVIDNPAAPGVLREIERTDLESIVSDLMTGRFDDPVQVVAFNTLEHWSHDLSSDVASEIQARCDIEATPLPAYLEDFVSRHARRSRVPSL